MRKEQLEILVNYANEINSTDWTADEIRNYSAPGEIIQYYTGSAYDDKVIKNLLVELLENLTTSELLSIFSEFNSYDGSFDFMEYYENDDEFFRMFFENDPMAAVRASFYGNYRYMDDYVRFNGYGNLESFSRYEVEQAAREYIEELAEYILFTIKDFGRKTYNDDIDGFIELLEELEAEEE